VERELHQNAGLLRTRLPAYSGCSTGATRSKAFPGSSLLSPHALRESWERSETYSNAFTSISRQCHKQGYASLGWRYLLTTQGSQEQLTIEITLFHDSVHHRFKLLALSAYVFEFGFELGKLVRWYRHRRSVSSALLQAPTPAVPDASDRTVR
jgi:hypothetical protein